MAGFTGHAPKIQTGVAPPITEQRKYQRLWERDEYRQVSPGEESVGVFLEIARPRQGASVIDFGAGTGRAALKLAQTGLDVTMLDFAPNCLDEGVRRAMSQQSLRFAQQDLTQPIPFHAEYGYCTDVMEHIPPKEVERVLQHILLSAQHVFFQIACTDDVMGKLIGHPLHLTVQPHGWWLQKLQALDCLVHWSQDFGSHCCFYVTAWQDGAVVRDSGLLNIAEEAILANIRANLEGDWQEVAPYWQQDQEVMILSAGPSLPQFEEHIRAQVAAGLKVVTVNGTYNWCCERGILPVTQVVVDARPFNARFTHPVMPGCRYLIASQVHPSVLEGLPKADTYLWHTGMEAARELISAKRPLWYAVPGGSTVTLRAIQLLLLLGFHRLHLYGFDSCLEGDAHHAFAQPENDAAMVIPVTVGGRIFRCHASMISQAREFMDLVRVMGEELDIEVYGDGLIHHIIQTGADLAPLEEH